MGQEQDRKRALDGQASPQLRLAVRNPRPRE